MTSELLLDQASGRVGVTGATTFTSIRLVAGVYAVKTNQRPFGTVPQPRTVRVRGSQNTRVDFAIDTGIR